MTVRELKEQLSKFKDNDEVFVRTTFFPRKANGLEKIDVGMQEAVEIT